MKSILYGKSEGGKSVKASEPSLIYQKIKEKPGCCEVGLTGLWNIPYDTLIRESYNVCTKYINFP